MPKNQKVWKKMVEKYGKKKAEDVYYGWEENQKKKAKKGKSKK